jgi:uncharacterized protein YciI
MGPAGFADCRARRLWEVELSLFVVVWHYVDDTELVDRIRPLHREFLMKLVEAGTVRQAGPWVDGSGGLLVFDVAGQDELDGWIEQDPFTVHGAIAHRQSWAWRPLVGPLSEG